MRIRFAGVLALLTLCATPVPAGATSTAQPSSITVLYDAFGKVPGLRKDWGYAALVEFSGKRILFDTGNNPDVLENNARTLKADLSRLDFVVMSHRHGDHMGGLDYLLKINPGVKIYAPKENFGVYGGSLPGKFYRRDEALPRDHRYFDGKAPETMAFGSAWPGAHFELIDQTTEIMPGIYLIALVSDKPGTMELKELSLAVRTPDGLVLIVGCAHPGLDKIIGAARTIDTHIQLLAGGFHLVVSSDEVIAQSVTLLHEMAQVGYVAPGHCTGEPTFAALHRAFADRYLYAGLGTVISLGGRPHSEATSGP